MQAHKDKKGPNDVGVVFFFIFIYLFLLLRDSTHGMPLPNPLHKRDPGWIISQGMLIIH